MISTFRGKYTFLSNFYIGNVEIYWGEDVTFFPSAEHAYQAIKAVNSVDRDRIKNARTPLDAKRLGNRIKMVPNWDAIKIGVMHEVLCAKFVDLDLQNLLLETGDSELIEGNTWGDQFWGATQDKNGQWKGKNWLGRLLMLRRSLLNV